MSEKIDCYAVVKKLIGSIDPVGETNTDKERLENLKNLCDLMDELQNDIEYLVKHKDSHEASVKAIGEKADGFLKKL